jgi:ComEC/Rec2-related protein
LAGYRIDIKNFAVPSVPIFLFVLSAVMLIYELKNGKFNSALIVFPALFTASFLFTLYCYLPVISAKGFKGYLVTLSICISSFLLIFSIVNRRISDTLPGGNIPETLNNPVIEITGSKANRAGMEVSYETPDEYGNKLKGLLIIKGRTSLNEGDTLLLHENVKRLEPDTDNGYLKNLVRQGFFYRSYAGSDDITVIEKNYSLRDKVRKAFFVTIDEIFPEESGSVVKALYSGNRSFISRGVILGFRDAGIIHILAASGLHVGIIAAIPMLFSFAGLSRKNLLTISLIMVAAYLYLTDMPVSLIRASVMFAVVYIQVLLNREVKALNSLFLAGTIVLLIFPWQLYSPGFQLSFGATAGIIIFYKGYRQVFNNFPGFVGKSFSATLAAQVVTVPLLFLHMNQFNLASLPANLAAVPLITGMMVLSVFALFLYPLAPYAALLAGKLTSMFYELLAMVTDFFSGMSLNYHIESGIPVFVISLIIAIVPFLGFKGRHGYSIVTIILAMLIPFVAFTRTYSDDLRLISITSGESIAEIAAPSDEPEISFKINDYEDGRRIFEKFKLYNIEPSVLEFNKYSFPGIIFSKMVLNNFRIKKVVINESISVKWGMEEIYRICDQEDIELLIKK